MEKEFSEGFLHDLADLMDYCKDNKTDSIDLHFVFGNKRLKMKPIKIKYTIIHLETIFHKVIYFQA